MLTCPIVFLTIFSHKNKFHLSSLNACSSIISKTLKSLNLKFHLFSCSGLGACSDGREQEFLLVSFFSFFDPSFIDVLYLLGSIFDPTRIKLKERSIRGESTILHGPWLFLWGLMHSCWLFVLMSAFLKLFIFWRSFNGVPGPGECLCYNGHFLLSLHLLLFWLSSPHRWSLLGFLCFPEK